MDLTIETVYKLEHELIGEASAWERDNPEEIVRLAFYNEGAHDMATRIADKVAKMQED